MHNSKYILRTFSLLLALLLTVTVICVGLGGCKDDKSDGTSDSTGATVTEGQPSDDGTSDGNPDDTSVNTEKRPPSEEKPSENEGGGNIAGGGPTDDDLPIIWE